MFDLKPLPNVRKLFLPDPNYTLIDADLEKADAHAVAWYANDQPSKDILLSGLNLHIENAKAIFNLKAVEKTGDHYHKAKTGVHAVNYGVKERTLASHLGITVHDADSFIKRWFAAHPAIEKWHRDVDYATSHYPFRLKNVWGYHRIFFDRPGTQLPEALAWLGQSCTSGAINAGLKAIFSDLEEEVELLLQVHDSLLCQVKSGRVEELAPLIKKKMEVLTPFSDPLTIPVSLKVSGESWGDVKEIKV